MKKKICVLHAQIPFSRGGAELLVENLVKKLIESGYDAQLISMPFKWYPEQSLYNSMLNWKLIDLNEINGESIDLVIPTKFPTYGIEHKNVVPWLMHQHRAAYDLFNNNEHYGFGTIENGLRMKNSVAAFDNNSFKTITNPIYTISKNVEKRLEQYNGFLAETLYPPAPLEGKYYCNTYEDYILSVGRLDPLKRVDLLIESLRFCDKRIKAKIAGRGSELEKLKALVEKLDLSDRVEFLGFVSDEELLKLYAEAYAVYFAPIDEDYGYITLEAFLSKKPVITCKDSGGVLEFLEKDKNGIICDSKAELIGEALEKLYNNKAVCKEMGEYGYKTVESITWKNVIDKLTATIK